MRFLCRAETANRTNRSSPRECVLSGGAQDKIWFDTTPPDDVLRTVQPLDEPVLSHRATVIVPGPKGLELASDVLGADDVGRQRLRFDEWFERLLATRGMVDTMWSTPKVESEDPLECDFARLGAVFDDVDPKLFQ